MPTLLILGSKPNPCLPARAQYDALACANASGYSAAQHGLPVPSYTVMTAVLTHRESGKQSLDALKGLETDILYFLARGEKKRGLLKTIAYHLRTLDMKPFYLKWRLRAIRYKYNTFIDKGYRYCDELIRRLCDGDCRVVEQIEKKRPSTGIFTLAIGIAGQQYDRFIMSGFSFELTRPYAVNPEIFEVGTTTSRHADTDIAVLGYLSRKYGNIYTTEEIVHKRTGVPMLTERLKAQG
ncbi:MAG: hypothetical protein U1F76_14495 [Candidatus Competibacteraceae bacterium]